MIVAHVAVAVIFAFFMLGLVYAGYRHFRKHDIVKPIDVIPDIKHEVSVLESHNVKDIDEVKGEIEKDIHGK